jgi:hypothetical protein
MGFPQAPEYTISAVSNFFGKFADIFEAQGENLPPISTTPGTKFATVLLIPVVNLDLRISSRIFKKIRNDPNVVFRGLLEEDSLKKT